MFKTVFQKAGEGQKSTKGFTLVELLVSISIFVIITSVVFLSQGSFASNLLISNLAYDIALTIRQAQIYGVSTRGITGVADADKFNRQYGVHFVSTGAAIKYYVLFVDRDGNGRYNANSDSGNGCIADPVDHNPECLNFFRIERGNSIQKFCTIASRCTNSPLAANRIDALDIMFKRPNPEAMIKGYKNDLLVSSPSTARIIITSPQNVTKTIIVSFIGQISVN
jgi:prepilin-type N-terminal cleavage/methylation domain-containing protein